MRAVFLRALLIWSLAWLLADSVEVRQLAARLSGDPAPADEEGYLPIAMRSRQQLHRELQASFSDLSLLDSARSHLVWACTWHELQPPPYQVPPSQTPSRYELMSLQI
jgi:hypothetical protein